MIVRMSVDFEFVTFGYTLAATTEGLESVGALAELPTLSFGEEVSYFKNDDTVAYPGRVALLTWLLDLESNHD